MIAVHEIATNAVRHGSPLARLVLQTPGGPSRRPRSVTAAPLAARAARSADSRPERDGLQLAHQVCDQVTIRRGAGGSTVILQMSMPGQDAARARAVPR